MLVRLRKQSKDICVPMLLKADKKASESDTYYIYPNVSPDETGRQTPMVMDTRTVNLLMKLIDILYDAAVTFHTCS